MDGWRDGEQTAPLPFKLIASDQRFISLPFTQRGQYLTVTLPGDPTVLLPGFYMLFAFNRAQVPSIAKILGVGLAAN